MQYNSACYIKLYVGALNLWDCRLDRSSSVQCVIMFKSSWKLAAKSFNCNQNCLIYNKQLSKQGKQKTRNIEIFVRVLCSRYCTVRTEKPTENQCRHLVQILFNFSQVLKQFLVSIFVLTAAECPDIAPSRDSILQFFIRRGIYPDLASGSLCNQSLNTATTLLSLYSE